MKITKKYYFTAFCAVFPAMAAAAIGPIVITPTRTEQAENRSSATVYLLTSEDIKFSGAKTTADLLRSMPGVQVDDLFGNGTEVTISVRGFSSTANANTLVLVNGRRLNHSDTAAPDLHHIFPKDIERIEVLVGSAGALYGDQAVGGVINIITKGPVNNLQQITFKAGSFDYGGVEFNSSKQLTEFLGYRLSAERFRSDHYRDHNTEANTNLRGILEYAAENQKFYIDLQKIDDDLELPGALIEAEYNADATQINAGFVNDFLNEDTSVSRAGYEIIVSDQTINLDLSHSRTDADVLQSFRDNPSPSAGFIKRDSESINPKLSGIISSAIELPYVVGLDLEKTIYDLSIPFDFFGPGLTTASNRQKMESLYFQLRPALTEMLQLSFGMRRSSVENDMKDGFSFPAGIEVDDDVSVTELGLAYQLDPQTRLSLRYDENYRFAKANELALAAPGNILKTQTGESIEIGVDLVLGDHQLIASIYQLNLKDEIEFDPNVGFGENINLDKTRRNGMTLSWFDQVSQSIVIKTELGFVAAKFESGSFKGNDISGVASEIAMIRGDFKINDLLQTYLEAHYTGPRYAQGDNANEFGKLDSIMVINTGINYRHMDWDFHFRINNLADEKYAEFITNNGFGAAYQPSPERNYLFSASYEFN